MSRKIYLDFLGCRLNQAEIEQMAREFSAQGDAIVEDAGEADLVVINTCAVTSNAGKVSRKTIRRAARANPNAEIVATGCYAHIAPETVAKLPKVSRVVDNFSKDQLVPMVSDDTPLYEREPVEREPLPPGTLGRTRAFVKVQDGCDNRCTFCVTTIARGEGRSRPAADILAEIEGLLAVGYQEVVLTGVHLGSYGHDLGDPNGLFGLVTAILHRTAVPRLRLSSLEPWDLTEGFFTLWADERLCPHLHLPLQSGCDATLRRMARKTTQAQFSALVEAARAHILGLTLTTDLIVGFPGETPAEWEASRAYVEAIGFARLHAFPYSARPGTAAARMPGQVPNKEKKARMQQALALSDRLWAAHLAEQVGTEASVLFESMRGVASEGQQWVGYTRSYLPVEVTCLHPLDNAVERVRITTADRSTLRGKLITPPAP